MDMVWVLDDVLVLHMECVFRLHIGLVLVDEVWEYNIDLVLVDDVLKLNKMVLVVDNTGHMIH